MIFSSGAINKYIIKEHQNKFSQEGFRAMIHQTLEVGWFINAKESPNIHNVPHES